MTRKFKDESPRGDAPGTEGSALQCGSGRSRSAGVVGIDYYNKLGVTKIINAAGTYTRLTASIMPECVQEAMTVAARSPVRLLELQQKAGEYIAARLRCEAALVTNGAAAALTLGTAACITAASRDAIPNVPSYFSGMKNEVLIQKAHRYAYDHAIRNCGIRFVEVNSLDEYEKGFSGRTAMAHFFNAADDGQISREDWIRVAHEQGVPCFNDAAADVPPIANLWKYTGMGFDLVAFSGGKGMRGPQNAGLLLGRKDLIEAAAANTSPLSDSIGRGMKVSKETIVGMVAAVDWILNQSDDEMEIEFRRRAELIAGALRDLPTVRSEIVVPPVANHVPHVIIRYNHTRVRISPSEAAAQLRVGSPSIELHPATGSVAFTAGLPADGNCIVVGVWMLQPGEELIVARRLHEVLSRAAGQGHTGGERA